jgi:hypothetical protein
VYKAAVISHCYLISTHFSSLQIHRHSPFNKHRESLTTLPLKTQTPRLHHQARYRHISHIPGRGLHTKFIHFHTNSCRGEVLSRPRLVTYKIHTISYKTIQTAGQHLFYKKLHVALFWQTRSRPQ